MANKIYLKVHKSRTKYFIVYLIAILAILSPLILPRYNIQINHFIPIVIGLIIILIMENTVIRASRLIIAENGIRKESGTVNKVFTNINYQDIVRTTVKQSGLARTFNYGSIEIDTTGRESAELEMKGIPNPLEIKKIIDHLIVYYKRK